jgi:hypothetical protein
MNPRHAKPRRPSKDRDVTWSRSYRTGRVMWTLWRRDHRRAIHMLVVTVTELDLENREPGWLTSKLRRAWHELRDFVDEIDLKETA